MTKALSAVSMLVMLVVVSMLCHLTGVYWLGNIKILKYAQFLCQFYELRKLNTLTGVEGYGFVAWFGQSTYIAFLVSLFGYTIPAYMRMWCVVVLHLAFVFL